MKKMMQTLLKKATSHNGMFKASEFIDNLNTCLIYLQSDCVWQFCNISYEC